jgi:hypothetical protein
MQVEEWGKKEEVEKIEIYLLGNPSTVNYLQIYCY